MQGRFSVPFHSAPEAGEAPWLASLTPGYKIHLPPSQSPYAHCLWSLSSALLLSLQPLVWKLGKEAHDDLDFLSPELTTFSPVKLAFPLCLLTQSPYAL